MKPKDSKIALTAALVGTSICLGAMTYFLFSISDNRLNLSADQPLRDHYIAVGHFYAQGFLVGFFLCLCLVVVAVAVSSWFEYRQANADLAGGPAGEPRLVRVNERFGPHRPDSER